VSVSKQGLSRAEKIKIRSITNLSIQHTTFLCELYRLHNCHVAAWRILDYNRWPVSESNSPPVEKSHRKRWRLKIAFLCFFLFFDPDSSIIPHWHLLLYTQLYLGWNLAPSSGKNIGAAGSTGTKLETVGNGRIVVIQK